MGRHLHLDALGGIAGDMFAAAMLDAFPALAEGLVPALHSAGLAADVAIRIEPVRDEVLAGTRFVVDDPRERGRPAPAHHHVRIDTEAHAHVPFSRVRRQIADSGLHPNVIARALDIFTRLASAEAHVHGLADVDAVVFHEVGGQDSIADIVGAAWLIENAHVLSWSSGSLPLGHGTIKTAHGVLPVPAPATAKLLEGFPVHDDNRPGERVTPTGAAIFAHLSPSSRRPAGSLVRAGIGWGTKRFSDLANILRVTEIDTAASLHHDEVSSIAFEIDDQPAEDLAVALDRLRALPGVVDVLQMAAFGKKGRMVTAVRVLCSPDAEERAVRASLIETTTLGVRVERIERVVLAREEKIVDGIRVKSVARPDGTRTAKADIDDARDIEGAAARAQLRRRAEES